MTATLEAEWQRLVRLELVAAVERRACDVAERAFDLARDRLELAIHRRRLDLHDARAAEMAEMRRGVDRRESWGTRLDREERFRRATTAAQHALDTAREEWDRHTRRHRPDAMPTLLHEQAAREAARQAYAALHAAAGGEP